jgi:hypothetical protein
MIGNIEGERELEGTPAALLPQGNYLHVRCDLSAFDDRYQVDQVFVAGGGPSVVSSGDRADLIGTETRLASKAVAPLITHPSSVRYSRSTS